jgi:heat shock protein HslJ
MGMKTKVGTLVLLASLAIAVSACGNQTQTTGSDRSEDLPGRTFLSTKVTEADQPRKLVPGTKVSLNFTDDGELVVNAGCNTLRSEVDASDGVLRVSNLGGTEMGCTPPLHEQDSWVAKVLEAEPTWRLDKNNLVVTSGQTEMVLLDRKVAEPDLALQGTKWTVTTYVERDVARSDAASSSGDGGAHLTFADGKVTGSGGCNQLSGEATVAGNEITFGPIVATKMACADKTATENEAHVLQVLVGKVTYEIDGKSLRLTNANGEGLGLSGG